MYVFSNKQNVFIKADNILDNKTNLKKLKPFNSHKICFITKIEWLQVNQKINV